MRERVPMILRNECVREVEICLSIPLTVLPLGVRLGSPLDSFNIHGLDHRGEKLDQFGNWFVSHWDEKLRTLLPIDPRVSKIKGIFPADELLTHLVCYPITITLLTLRVFFYTLKDPTVVTTIAFFNYNW